MEAAASAGALKYTFKKIAPSRSGFGEEYKVTETATGRVAYTRVS